MSRSVTELLADALALDADDRAQMANRLVASLDGDAVPGAEHGWAVEIERRLARLDAGEARLLTMDDALVRLRRTARAR